MKVLFFIFNAIAHTHGNPKVILLKQLHLDLSVQYQVLDHPRLRDNAKLPLIVLNQVRPQTLSFESMFKHDNARLEGSVYLSCPEYVVALACRERIFSLYLNHSCY